MEAEAVIEAGRGLPSSTIGQTCRIYIKPDTTAYNQFLGYSIISIALVWCVIAPPLNLVRSAKQSGGLS